MSTWCERLSAEIEELSEAEQVRVTAVFEGEEVDVHVWPFMEVYAAIQVACARANHLCKPVHASPAPCLICLSASLAGTFHDAKVH